MLFFFKFFYILLTRKLFYLFTFSPYYLNSLITKPTPIVSKYKLKLKHTLLKSNSRGINKRLTKRLISLYSCYVHYMHNYLIYVYDYDFYIYCQKGTVYEICKKVMIVREFEFNEPWG